MPIPFRDEDTMARVLSAERAAVLARVAGVRLSPRVAGVAWERVQEHKWLVSERLGRDVGLRFAALDWLENHGATLSR
jgi:hypothetical protein